jgi:hypothetical protein
VSQYGNLIDVMLSEAKHLAFSGCHKVGDSSAAPQNDITTQVDFYSGIAQLKGQRG